MMIRINLLAVRQVRKHEDGKQFLAIAAVLLVGVLGANYWWLADREGDRDVAAARLAATQAKIAEKVKQIGEVDQINARRQEVQQKLDVLDQLKDRRSGPVKMMDALATVTPEKVWVKDFKDVSGAVLLSGAAMTLDDVSNFMRGLKEIVWTNRGIGRLVDQRRDAKTVRVELLDSSGPDVGTLRDFDVAEVKHFFSGVELRKTVQNTLKAADVSTNVVDFEVAMTANDII